jgi:hypothetical protein
MDGPTTPPVPVTQAEGKRPVQSNVAGAVALGKARRAWALSDEIDRAREVVEVCKRFIEVWTIQGAARITNAYFTVKGAPAKLGLEQRGSFAVRNVTSMLAPVRGSDDPGAAVTDLLVLLAGELDETRFRSFLPAPRDDVDKFTSTRPVRRPRWLTAWLRLQSGAVGQLRAGALDRAGAAV